MPDLQSLFSHIYDYTWGVLWQAGINRKMRPYEFMWVKRYAASIAF